MASSPAPSPQTIALLQKAFGALQAGRLQDAREAAASGLLAGDAKEAFHGLLGMLDCESGQLEAGIGHFRAALAIRPDDAAVRANLVRALIGQSDYDAALEACPAKAADNDPRHRLLRLRAWLLQETGAFDEAASAYQRIVQDEPADFEGWNNLGNALSGAGDVAAGLEAIRKAVSLSPGNAPVRLNLATTLLQAENWSEAETVLLACCADFPLDEKPRLELAALYKSQGRDADALVLLQAAAALAPNSADLQVKLAMEEQFAWNMVQAEAGFRKAILLEPSMGEAHLLLGLHLEHLNRPEEFGAVLDAAKAGCAEDGVIHFIQALAHRRDGKFDEGLEELALVPPDLEPIRAAQLRGQFLDRLGRTDEAFAAFSEMNRLQQDDPTEPVRRAREYRDALSQDRAMVTTSWYKDWRNDAVADGRASPTFLLGFPRSGTTLLDTMLMGHPAVRVLEERPPIARVEDALGGLDRLPGLSGVDIKDLRAIYFEEAARWTDVSNDLLLVDKFPLHLNKVPIIHRLFPDAKFILALRHPMDVLLSCFITNFRLNSAMANFLDLETAAKLYDESFGFWEQASSIFNVQHHTVRYEQMVEDGEKELKPLFGWLGLDWQDNVLDHQTTASRRKIITTASYAQVTEPIYTRAKGRWENYRDMLAPIRPVITPWAEKFGYEV